MFVRVLKTFRDKHTRALYRPGDMVEVTEERAKEMNATPHGVMVEILSGDAPTEPPEETPPETPPMTTKRKKGE